MPYLNLDLDYFTHVKTVRLVGLLGRGAEVLPIRLWCYCGRHHAESGRLTGYSAQEIAAALVWWGDPIKAVEGLVKVGFLEQLEDGYQVHDWKEHSGHLAVFKKRAKQAARTRWKKLSSNASSIAKDDVKQSPNIALPSLALPNKEIKDPPQNGGIFKPPSPYKIDLKDVDLPLDEGGKHRLYNDLVAVFEARGWLVDTGLLKRVFVEVAKTVKSYQPREIFPYFKKSLQVFINQNAEWLSAEVKKSWDKKPEIANMVQMR